MVDEALRAAPKLRARSGCRPRSLDRRRTRDTPVAVSLISRGSLRISPT
jgi:hypothetical protein